MIGLWARSSGPFPSRFRANGAFRGSVEICENPVDSPFRRLAQLVEALLLHGRQCLAERIVPFPNLFRSTGQARTLACSTSTINVMRFDKGWAGVGSHCVSRLPLTNCSMFRREVHFVPVKITGVGRRCALPIFPELASVSTTSCR